MFAAFCRAGGQRSRLPSMLPKGAISSSLLVNGQVLLTVAVAAEGRKHVSLVVDFSKVSKAAS